MQIIDTNGTAKPEVTYSITTSTESSSKLGELSAALSSNTQSMRNFLRRYLHDLGRRRKFIGRELDRLRREIRRAWNHKRDTAPTPTGRELRLAERELRKLIRQKQRLLGEDGALVKTAKLLTTLLDSNVAAYRRLAKKAYKANLTYNGTTWVALNEVAPAATQGQTAVYESAAGK